MPLSPGTPIRLRPLEPRPIVQHGQRAIWLRDPLALSDKRVVVPQQLVPLLTLIDGSRDCSALRASLAVRHGLALPEAAMLNILRTLDEAYLLDNEHSKEALGATRDAFRAAPFREPALAGDSYPANAIELGELLDGYLNALPEAAGPPGNWRGLVSPHIDYSRGGATYAHAWREAREAAQSAKVVIILGTDHYGSPGHITLTRQHYATPYGVLPTDQEVVNAIAEAIGEENAFAEELHHRSEHSIELSAVWLHHMRGGEPCDLVPILCGPIDHLSGDDRSERTEGTVGRFVETLRRATSGRQVLVIASADLAHVGPAFGGRPHYELEKAIGKGADEEMLATLSSGNPDGFLAHVRRDGNARHVCGVAPIYLTFRLLVPTEGHLLAYGQCLADEQGTSWVSVCALTLS